MLISPSVKGMHKEMGNNSYIRSDWKCKPDPSAPAAQWQQAVYCAPNCSPQGTTLFYRKRTAWSSLRALWLRISTGVVYKSHFYILVGQDNNCTCAETRFLWDPYAFHTCSKNTINKRTIVLCITQFGLEIQILVSYPRNEIDFFQSKTELRTLILLIGWQWTDISANDWFLVTSFSLRCIWIVCFI